MARQTSMARFFYVASAQEHVLTVVQLRSESEKPRLSTIQKFNEATRLNFCLS